MNTETQRAMTGDPVEVLENLAAEANRIIDHMPRLRNLIDDADAGSVETIRDAITMYCDHHGLNVDEMVRVFNKPATFTDAEMLKLYKSLRSQSDMVVVRDRYDAKFIEHWQQIAYAVHPSGRLVAGALTDEQWKDAHRLVKAISEQRGE